MTNMTPVSFYEIRRPIPIFSVFFAAKLNPAFFIPVQNVEIGPIIIFQVMLLFCFIQELFLCWGLCYFSSYICAFRTFLSLKVIIKYLFPHSMNRTDVFYLPKFILNAFRYRVVIFISVYLFAHFDYLFSSVYHKILFIYINKYRLIIKKSIV